MKKIVLFISTMIICYTAHSQNILHGKVIEKDSKDPLIGVIIYISDLKKGASTDTSGNYLITHLPSGKYLVEIKYLGYASKVLKVDINGDTKLDIELSPAVTEMHEVVITGVSHATEVRQNPVPTLLIPKTVMLENTSTNLIDAISRQPGISQISTGAAISKPVVRGLGYNRVITLNNGLRQEGQQWGDEHGIEIDEYSIDRTEVIKGPGSLMYGSDAMAGVINFIAPNPVDNGKIIGNIQSNYQTNNGLIGNSIMTAGNNNGFNWLARASKKDAHPYSNAYDGKVFNSGFNELDYNGMIGLNKKWGYTHLTFNSFNQNIGMVEGDRDSAGKFVRQIGIDNTIANVQATSSDLNSYKLFVPNQQINHNRIATQNYLILGPSKLAIDLSWQQNQRREFGDPLNPNQYGLYFLLRTFTYDVKYFLPELKGFETTLGVNGMQQANQNKGTDFLIPEYSLFDYGIFAVTKKSFNKLNVSGGVRFDHRLFTTKALYLGSDNLPVASTSIGANQKFAGYTLNFSNVASSIGATYTITDKLLVKLNLSKGFRAPNAAELASNGKHEGTLRYEYGNPNLKAETSFQYDAGLSYISEHVTFDLAMFQNRIQNYIFVERLSSVYGRDSIVDSTDPVPTYKYEQGNAVLTGGEASIDIHPHPLDWLHFENSFSYVQGLNQGRPDSSKYLPFMPPARFLSELKANIKQLSVFKNNYIKIQYDNYFAQNKVLLENNTETPTKGYQLINLGAGSTIVSKKGNTLFSVYFSVNNIFDVAYQNHLSRIKYAAENLATGRVGIFNMGRNFSFKLIIPLAFK